MNKKKEIPIGGIGIIDGVRVMVMKSDYKIGCDLCYWQGKDHKSCPYNKCDGRKRDDKTHVYFVQAEKGGLG